MTLQNRTIAVSGRRVIAVDLDGTLVRSDMLVESLFLFLRAHPLGVFRVLAWLLKGKAYFKRRIADEVLPDARLLPYHRPLIEWLTAQRAAGATLVLATASDLRIGRAIAQHTGLFDDVMGTEGHNLASSRKRDALVARYGEGGFEYVGNSQADLAIWRVASLSHIVNPEIGVMPAFRKLGCPTGEVFEDRAPYPLVLRKALRLHQWAKNLLVFVPLFAAHRFLEPGLLASCVLAFLCFGACASSVYLLNDLLDLPEDRQHRSKSRRPLAAGTFPVFHALLLMPGLLLFAFAAALLFLPLLFSAVLLGYYLLTLAYSFGLKRMAMLDVVTLAMLYTVRVVAGTAAAALSATFWILAFCVFLFLSLAFVKRYTELQDAYQAGSAKQAPGRGYMASDFPLLGSLGTAAGYLSVLVLALYVNDTAPLLYRHPQVMWMACPLLLYWLSRVWLLAHRGEMHDDPIVFALSDRASRWVGVCFVLTFVLAA